MSPHFRSLVEAAAEPYRATGKYGWHFARGKLRHDPVYAALLFGGVLPDSGRLDDFGCGQGLLLSLLDSAKQQYLSGQWPADSPAPPLHLTLRGIDSNEARVKLARRALGARAQIDHSDVRDAAFGPCSVIVLVDVLLYLDAAAQERVLVKASQALADGGLLLLREPDASAGFAFQATKWSAHFDAATRGSFGHRLHCRSPDEWSAMLERRGFAVRTEAMSRGTPFRNVLFVARKVV